MRNAPAYVINDLAEHITEVIETKLFNKLKGNERDIIEALTIIKENIEDRIEGLSFVVEENYDEE